MSSPRLDRTTRIATPLVVLTLLVLAAPVRSAAPLLLVTPEEAKLPIETKVASKTLPSDGPIIDVSSPTNGGTYDGPFPIVVEFRSGENGLPVDMGSFQLEYKRAWGIDITSRVRGYIDGLALRIAQAEVPPGRHSVEIRIRDIGSNLSARILTVTVR
jgi:hypothetical protein